MAKPRLEFWLGWTGASALGAALFGLLLQAIGERDALGLARLGVGPLGALAIGGLQGLALRRVLPCGRAWAIATTVAVTAASPLWFAALGRSGGSSALVASLVFTPLLLGLAQARALRPWVSGAGGWWVLANLFSWAIALPAVFFTGIYTTFRLYPGLAFGLANGAAAGAIVGGIKGVILLWLLGRGSGVWGPSEEEPPEGESPETISERSP